LDAGNVLLKLSRIVGCGNVGITSFAVNLGAEFLRDRTCVCLKFQRLSVNGNGIGFISTLNLRGNINELVF
jgi:hypothetical protein